MRTFRTVLILVVTLAGCAPDQTSKTMVVVDAVGFRTPVSTLELAVFSTVKTPLDVQALVARYREKYPELRLSDQLVVVDAQRDYTPPTPDFLSYFARGLDEVDKAALGAAAQAIVVTLKLENRDGYLLQKQAGQLMSDIAGDYQGYVWDDATRLVFTKTSWDEGILSSWENGTVLASRNIAIHQYQEGELLRSITLGMSKFGLPDLVVQSAPRNNSRSVGNTLNVLAQTLLENPSLRFAGRLELSLDALKPSTLKDAQRSGLFENGSGKGAVYLEVAPHDEGDPDNLLWGIKFTDFNEKDQTVKQEAFFGSFFGSNDPVTHVKHDEEILAASAAAKKQLPELQRQFSAGLPPGDSLLVKLPFATPSDGNEWMWVEVIAWKAGEIRGILQNQPYYIPTLKVGEEVSASEDKVFDYLYYHADGSEEGNETGKLIEKLGGSETP